MPKYTSKPYDCNNCSKRNYFLIEIVKKNRKTYYLTQCPRCNSYDEVKKLAPTEIKAYEIQTD